MKQHVVIAGGSHGIGAACRDKYLAEGFQVTSLARSSQEVDTKSRFLPLSVDLRDRQAVNVALDQARSEFGEIKRIVHSVGDIGSPVGVASLGWSRWRETLDLNLGTAVNLVEGAFDDLCRAGSSASVTFVSSVAALRPYPGISDYCAAKAALSNFSKSVAMELAPTKGRSNTVCPAVVRTRIFENAPFDENAASSFHALGRIGEPIEVASLISYLGSDQASWITGQDYQIDGGMFLPSG